VAAGLGGLVVLGLQRLTTPANEANPEDVLATVDGRPITVQAFEHEMQRRSGGSMGVFAALERRRALLDEMIQFQVLLANAKRAGYDRDPELRSTTERMVAGKYRSEHIDPYLAEVSVSDTEIESYYQQHIAQFTVPEKAHAALVYVAWNPTTSAQRRAELIAKADSLRKQAEALSEPTFGALAVQSNDQATRYFGGDIGWLVRGKNESQWETAVVDAIFALNEPGQLAPPLQTEQGIYIIKLIEPKKPAAARPLEEVRTAIAQRMLSEKRQRRSDELYADAQHGLRIEVNEARLRGLEIPRAAVTKQEDKPPALPPG